MQRAFEALRAYLRRASGLIIDSDKIYLVESRVLPIVRREKLSGLDELVVVLERGSNPAVAREVVQAMTINETYFFRDKLPFDKFRDVMMPKLIAARAASKCIRIWSAASSTGQEAYSLSIILEEMQAKLAGWRIEIIATDLAEHILERAKKGIYTQFEVQRGLTTQQLLRYFTQVGDQWQIKEPIRNRVQFRHFNLLDDYGALGRFDIIFCRNVLIYFDLARKTDILNRMSRALAPDGFLIQGASEGVIGLGTDLVVDPEHRCFFIHGAQAQTAPRPAMAASGAGGGTGALTPVKPGLVPQRS
jgi:chemotaxis protein methyltransferase CheR